MTEQTSQQKVDRPPPVSEKNLLRWIRKNLFSTWYNTLFTAFFVYLLYLVIPPALQWLFLNADFFTQGRDECTSGGACWGVITARFEQYLYGFYPKGQHWRPNLAFVLLIVALLPIFWDNMKWRMHFMKFSAFYPILAFWILFGGFYLPSVDSTQIGGLSLTIVLGFLGIGLSLPIGTLLALGRRSDLPILRLLCVIVIEFIRGVPMISLLFMATVMFPLFLPPGSQVDQLWRVIFIVVIFSSAYIAEVVRGGLQAIPRGQIEASDALGLKYWQMMRLVILPQALKISIPGIVTTFIGLFKDTTLVLIVGMFDLLGVGRAALSNKQWIGLANEVYTFIAFVFFIFCYSMARYSVYLEKKLSVDHR